MQMLDRLKALTPNWFGRSVPDVVEGVLSGYASSFQCVSDIQDEVSLQTRIRTATGGNLDLIARDYFNQRMFRRKNEGDDAYKARLLAEIFRERVTLAGMRRALLDLTGFEPKIWEPGLPDDGGGYNRGIGGYGQHGRYASLNYPAQAFIVAYRTLTVSTVPNVTGYNRGLGGYGVGRIKYVRLADSVAGLLDQEIMDTVRRTAAAGVKCWVCILSHKALTEVNIASAWTASGSIAAAGPEVSLNIASAWTASGDVELGLSVGFILASVWEATGDVAASIEVERPLGSVWEAAGDVALALTVERPLSCPWSADGSVTAPIVVERPLASSWTASGDISAALLVASTDEGLLTGAPLGVGLGESELLGF
jgi:hypothetical protein